MRSSCFSVHAALLGIAIAVGGAPQEVRAQRPAPQVVDFGNPATKEIVHGRLVMWDVWGVRAESCASASIGVECTLTVMNGGSESSTLCIGEAALGVDGPDSTAMSIVPGAEQDRVRPRTMAGFECLAIDPHKQTTLSVRSRSRANRPIKAIGLTLIERQPGPGVAKTHRARARVPIGGLST